MTKFTCGSSALSERLAKINSGHIETANLAECLSVDFAAVMGTVLPEIGKDAICVLETARQVGILKRMEVAGDLIHERLGLAVLDTLRNHPSDTVRGWGCFVVGAIPDISIGERLAAIRSFAADPHFGVREWAWMAVRPHLVQLLDISIGSLVAWTGENDVNLRRFAVEALRPRGIWCKHIPELKSDPSRGLPLLAPLRGETDRYAQDSVSNWLNDAAKDNPNWVRELCKHWQNQMPDNENTKRIAARAMRSIK